MSTLLERRGTDAATGQMTELSLFVVDDKVATTPEIRALIASLMTKADVGLPNADNTADADKPNSIATIASLLLKADDSALTAHSADNANPHNATKAQVGLANVDNVSDINKPISAATSTTLSLKADLVGGLVPAAQLPGFVDDVLNFADLASFPATGEDGKIYLAEDTNKTYRWSLTVYVEVGGGGVALGETSSTAYRGDRGKIAFDYSQAAPAAITAEIATAIAAQPIVDYLASTTGEIVWNNAIGNSSITFTTINGLDYVDTITQIDGAITRTWVHAYDANGDLTTVTIADGTDTFISTYTYAVVNGTPTFTGWVKQ